MKNKIISVITAVAFAAVSAVALCSCKDNTPSDTGNPDEGRAGLSLSGYKTVYCAEDASENIVNAADVFNAQLKKTVSIACKVKYFSQSDEKAFLIGNTGHAKSEEALQTAELESGGHEHAYAILLSENTIAINGNDETAVLAGMKYFLDYYADSAEDKYIDAEDGDTVVKGFDGELRVFPNLVQLELISESLVDKPTEPADSDATLKYPCIIELNYQPNPADNGTLIATGERWIGGHLCPVYRSKDGGKTWEHVVGLEDTFHPGFRTAFAPSVYELPVAVGDMPAGTLIAGADSINEAWTEIHIVLFRSFDGGDTWECFKTLASGGSNLGAKGGVWEPFFYCTDNGTLVCHYSDEVNSPSSQMLVYKYTEDGENWSDIVKTVELTDRGLRPGMPVVTRLGDGRYMMVYEIVVLPGNPVYCKYSDDGLDWGDAADTGSLIRTDDGKSLAATPWVAYSPVETPQKQGMIVVTGWRMASGSSETGSDILLSFDGGESWTSMPNYYSYVYNNDADVWGYSVCVYFSSDGETMYYLANPKGETEKSVYKLFTIKVS